MIKNHHFRSLFFVFFLFAVIGFALKDFSPISFAQTQKTRETTCNKNPELNVSVEFWKQQQQKALEERKEPSGDNVPGLLFDEILRGGDITKQKAKMAEMTANGYIRPMDFADLALKRMSGELIELPIATESYVLDVGGSANDGEFTSFDFENQSVVLKPESSKYILLKQLAEDFDGMKYDLQNPQDRRQIKIRLLRMLNPQTRKVLEEIAAAYFKKFNRPLRIVSMVRSMEYQISLNKTSANSFRVRGNDSLPPHVSGCAIDLSRKQMTAEEQNFIGKKLAEMETGGKIDALVEFGDSPVFHFFVYADGKPPKV